MTPRLGFVNVGPAWHGVTRFGRSVADAVDACGAATTSRFDIDEAAKAASRIRPNRRERVDLWIVQFTDHVFSAVPVDAADRLIALCEGLPPAPVAVVLHDIPDATRPDDPRAAAYRRVAESADIVVVCSHYEAQRLHRCGFAGATQVIRQMIPTRIPSAVGPCRLGHSLVGLLGFVYPGKGHLAGVEACARQSDVVGFVALGRPSPGHEEMVDVFAEQAERSGVSCTVTGWLDDRPLAGWLDRIDVPIAPYENVSASSSLATWLGAGRRPIVRDGPYVAELAALAPGAMTIYDGADPDALARHVGAALLSPECTRQTGLPAVLSPTACAAAYIGLAR